MASYTDELMCSICLAVFSDPVTIVCGHSFCRECITSLSSEKSSEQIKVQQCPQCRATIPQELANLPTNHILKSLAERVREKERLKAEYRNDEVAAEVCPEHEEKMKLFCITDKELICVICREAQRHRNHKFQPIKEAAQSLRRELHTFTQQVSTDIFGTEKRTGTQRKEMDKNRVKCQQLMDQISKQFEKMHDFLRKKEEEIKNDLKQKAKEETAKMTKVLNDMETSASESRELKGKVETVLEISDAEKLIKSWTTDKDTVAAKNSFRSKSFLVVQTCLSLGPYESHLQFLVWREMLGVIHPRGEDLALKSDGIATVSDDKKSLSFKSRYLNNSYTSSYTDYASASSVNRFTSGKHYWEVVIGNRSYWELGVTGTFLKFDGSQYVTNGNAQLDVSGRPQKIGIYLNCASGELSFYNAETMSHLHTMTHVPVLQSAHFRVGVDPNPLTVCCYARDEQRPAWCRF